MKAQVAPSEANSPTTPAKKDVPNFEVSPRDERLENGPIEERGCTDILCCIVFILYWIGLVIVGITALSEGSPRLKYVAALYDSDGYACGISGSRTDSAGISTDYDYTAYPYLYYPRPYPSGIASRVCVSACPSNTTTGSLPTNVSCKTNSNVTSCQSTTSTSLSLESIASMSDSSTYFIVYNSEPYLDSLCFPTDAAVWNCVQCQSFMSQVLSGSDQMEQWISDLKLTWPLFFAVGAIAFAIGFVFMILMRYLSGIITWLMCFAFIGALLAAAIICYSKSQGLSTDEGIKALTASITSPSAKAAAESTTSNTSTGDNSTQKTFYALSIFFFIMTGVCLIGLCCLYHKISLVIAVLKAGADYLKATPSALTVPIFILVLLIGFLSWWFPVFICQFAMGAGWGDSTLPFSSINWDQPTKYFVLYHSFGFLWNIAFIMALSEFVQASSTAIWYYAQGPESNGAHGPVRRSFYRAFRYHLGSLALGSFLIAVIQAVQLVLLYIQKQLKDAKVTQNNKIVEYAMKLAMCLVNCFERFIQFINRNAYIQIAVRGTNFCQAAKDAFFLIFQNPTRFALMSGLGELFLLVGQLFITFTTTCIGYAILVNSDTYSKNLNSPLLPCIFFFFISYVISLMFMAVYGMACDTILQCFCVDEDISKSKGKAPQHCPAPLKDLFDSVDKSE